MKSLQFNFEGIGTHWVVDINSNPNEISSSEIFEIIQDKIEEYSKTYSRFRDDSLISQLKETGEVVFPDNFIPLISTYRKLYDLSDGLITPLVGNLLESLGYDKSYSLYPKESQEVPKWDDVLHIKRTKVISGQRVTLDFGAAGKGYLIDLVGKALEELGILEYCIDAGGDILVKGNKPLRIGLENPLNSSEAIGEVEIANKCICGSSGNRRKWGNYHHILNPRTQKSVEDVLAVWSVADDGLTTDALSTALFFIPSETLQKYFDFQFLILYPDFSIKKSENFIGSLYHA